MNQHIAAVNNFDLYYNSSLLTHKVTNNTNITVYTETQDEAFDVLRMLTSGKCCSKPDCQNCERYYD